MPTVSYIFGNVLSEFVANTTTAGTQRSPVVAVDETTNNIFLAFTSDRAGGGVELRGRTFTRDGDALSTDFLIAGGPAGTFQTGPAISSLADTVSSDGGFIVAYQDDTDAATDGANIEWARYSNIGLLQDGDVAPEVDVSPNLDAQREATVTGLTNGSYVVAYTDQFGGSSTNVNITHAVYLADGTLINSGAHYSAGTLTNETLGDPSVAALQTGGGFVMAWREDVEAGAGTNNDIRAQRFDSIGDPVGGVIDINTESDAQFDPKVIGLPDGGFAVVYGDQQAGSAVDQRVEMNIYDSNGSLVIEGVAVAATSGTELFFGIDVSIISDNYMLVTYSRDDGSATNFDVFASAFDFSGNQIGSEFNIEVTANEQLRPSVAGLGNGQFVTAWDDSASDTPDFSGSHIALQIDQLSRRIFGDETDELLVSQDDLTDVIYGLAGNDVLVGGLGDDILYGGQGDDIVSYGSGFQFLSGGSGNDSAFFGLFNSAVWVDLEYTGLYEGQNAEAWTKDTTDLDSGEWRGIANLASVENVVGTLFDDTIYGDSNDNVFGYGGLDGGNGGFDTYDGRGGSDTVAFGTAGSAVWVDLSYAGPEVWTQDDIDLEGGFWRSVAELSNIENVVASNFSDELRGDSNDNTFTYSSNAAGEGGFDYFAGSSGSDTASFSQSAFAVWADLEYSGNEAWTRDGDNVDSGTWREIADLVSIENLTGSEHSDFLAGDAFNNTLGFVASAPGGGGFDILDGRGGSDTADFSGASFAVWVDLQYAGNEAWTRDGEDVATGDWREIADLAGIENITGSEFSDMLYGDIGSNTFSGLSGDDTIDGRGGNDVADFTFGVLADFTITDLAGADWTITHNVTGDVASLISIETVSFSDTDIFA